VQPLRGKRLWCISTAGSAGTQAVASCVQPLSRYMPTARFHKRARISLFLTALLLAIYTMPHVLPVPHVPSPSSRAPSQRAGGDLVVHGPPDAARLPRRSRTRSLQRRLWQVISRITRRSRVRCSQEGARGIDFLGCSPGRAAENSPPIHRWDP